MGAESTCVHQQPFVIYKAFLECIIWLKKNTKKKKKARCEGLLL